MIGALLSALSWVLGKLFSKPQGLSQESQQAAKAAVATTSLQVEQQSNVEVQKAAVAVAIVTRATDSNDKLRQYESADPNNRDND